MDISEDVNNAEAERASLSNELLQNFGEQSEQNESNSFALSTRYMNT